MTAIWAQANSSEQYIPGYYLATFSFSGVVVYFSGSTYCISYGRLFHTLVSIEQTFKDLEVWINI